MRTNSSVKSSILQLIQQYAPISIRMLSTLTHLSIPHVTGHVEALLQANLLREDTQASVSAGRKPKLYSINPDYGYLMGVDFGLMDGIRVGIFDLAGTLRHHFTHPFKSNTSGAEIIESLLEDIEANLAPLGIPTSKLLSIVIGNPGVVDDATGRIHRMSAESARWGNLPLRQIFEERFGPHTIVLNDVNLCAIGEKEWGIGKGYKNFLFIRNEIGLKSGIIIKDRLYQGESGAAGEIGLNVMITPPSGDESFQVIPVESLLSMSFVCRKIADELPNHPEDFFYAAVGGDPEQINVDTISKVLGRGSFVDGIIQECGRLFGLILVNTVTTLDIALVIISGDMAILSNYFFKSVRDAMAEHLAAPPTVLTSSLGDCVALYGAYSVGMETVCSEQTENLE